MRYAPELDVNRLRGFYRRFHRYDRGALATTCGNVFHFMSNSAMHRCQKVQADYSVKKASTRQLPRLLAKYNVGDMVGEGGAAEVYDCAPIAGSGATASSIVCKILVDFSNDRDKRFHEEARFLQRFQHPNIVRVLDYIEEEHVMVWTCRGLMPLL